MGFEGIFTDASKPFASACIRPLLFASGLFCRPAQHVYIGAGAKIIGGVTIGDHCRIGANAVVYTDMPPHSVAVCAPTRIIQKQSLDNTYTTVLDGQTYQFRDGKLTRV